MRRRIRGAVFSAVVLASLALPGPTSAQFVENPVGTLRVKGTNELVLDTLNSAQPRVWFGLRLFTVPAGTMTNHNALTTANTSLAYSSQARLPGNRVLCASDFSGRGSPTGGILGPHVTQSQAQPADNYIAMIGGFVGTGTGCVRHPDFDPGKLQQNNPTRGEITFTMSTTGPIVQAFYGAFWGTSTANWRSDIGNATGNHVWWNLWGNFTQLGYGSTG